MKDVAAPVADWLARFERALTGGDVAEIKSLFHADSHWRDVLALSWRIDTVSGADPIAGTLGSWAKQARPSGFVINPARAAPRAVMRAGADAIEAIFKFETEQGRCSGVLRLTPVEGKAPKAWTLLTALEELKGHEEQIGRSKRPDGEAYSRDFRGPNWLDQRKSAEAFSDRDPAVLVVGGGQAGLAVAARLSQLGLDALIVDREQRIGDNWRKRYHALVLHNQVHVNHLPYMPFPPNTPSFIPKDKLANWFEAYADAMDLNVWTGTELAGARYDESTARWEATVRSDKGSERVVRPKHIVFATGISGVRNLPSLPGAESFGGTVIHSAEYTDGHAWRGRKVLVLGTGNSAHDVAHDLQEAGADVTMIQRGATTIISLEQAQRPYGLYELGYPIDDADLLGSVSPYPLQIIDYQHLTNEAQEADKELLRKLAARGFRIDHGVDGTGYIMKFLRQGGGYYFNVGCSDLIVEGKIKLLQYEQIERFIPAGLLLKNGEQLGADLLVLATGYKNQQELVRQTLGDEVAEAVGPIWGVDEDGEQRNMWRRTAQPGLWFMSGGLPQVRVYSKYLAMQIKAIEDGLMSATSSLHGPQVNEVAQ